MYCKNCGSQLTDEETLCRYCGKEVVLQTQSKPKSTSYTPPKSSQTNSVPPHSSTTSRHTPKSKVGAAIFAIILGVFGVHNFYLGFNGRAIIQLILTIAGYSEVAFMWALIEFILILTNSINSDAKGIRLV